MQSPLPASFPVLLPSKADGESILVLGIITKAYPYEKPYNRLYYQRIRKSSHLARELDDKPSGENYNCCCDRQCTWERFVKTHCQ